PQGVSKVVRPGQRVGSGAVNGTFASRAAPRTALSRRSTTPTCRSRHHTCRESAVRGTKAKVPAHEYDFAGPLPTHPDLKVATKKHGTNQETSGQRPHLQVKIKQVRASGTVQR